MSTVIPSNRAPFTVEDALAATSGQLLQRGGDAVGVGTDTRTIEPGNAFVALLGDRFDGHDHAKAAIERGATLLVVSRAVAAPPGVTVVLVEDTTHALGHLGRAHRRRWAARRPGRRPVVVAITGSAGKTTTRRAVAALLEGLGGQVHASTGNLNNAVGIPMVLLGLTAEHDTAVVEIGTSRRGEVAHGASIVEPDLAILTLIAAAHTEGIGTLEDVAREKGALLEALGPNGFAIVNGDDPRCAAALMRSQAHRWIHYGTSERCDVRIARREPVGLRGSQITLSLQGAVRGGWPILPVTPASIEGATPLLGSAGAYATAAAVAAACALAPEELSSAALTAAFGALDDHDSGRLTPRSTPGGAIVIDDSYNANGASSIAGIETARELAEALGRRLVLVLGEMRELGPLSAEEHDRVGRAVATARPARFVAVQGDAERMHRAARAAGLESTFVPDAAAAALLLEGAVGPADLVLVKGSRSVGLERVVAALSRGI